jgi:endonuclease/exonuclease/phosphatase family metal-dependent hydrolase
MLTKRYYRVVVMAVILGLLLSSLPNVSFSQETVTPQGAVVVPPAQDAGSSDIKVMTWNILGGRRCKLNRRMEKVAEEVMRHRGLDVIALQEVYRSQALKLAQHLRDAGFGSFFTHFVKTKTCDDDNAGKDFGIAILSRHLILPTRDEYPLPQAPQTSPDSGKPCDRDERRKLAAITTVVRGRPIRVYASHLTSCGGAVARITQAEAIIRQVRSDEKRFERVMPFKFRPILMGDLNTRPLAGAYSVFTERFRDAWGNNAGGFTFHTLSTVNERAAKIRIDYIFYGSGDFRLDEVRVTDSPTLFRIFEVAHPEALDPDADELPIPDHRPLIARLSYI